MRFATYNIWNSDIGIPSRTDDLIKTLAEVKADVLCLQEVRDDAYCALLSDSLAYPYYVSYTQENLAVLSRFPIESSETFSHCVTVNIVFSGFSVAIANVHLPWDSVLNRERASVQIHQALTKSASDLRLLMGDFNSSERSSVHQFFLGEASLHGEEAIPCWFDLAEGFACRHNTVPEDTLNFYKNPRWNIEATVEVNQRVDRILLQNPYPNSFPNLSYVGIFGTDISGKTGYAPSDHYGVYADIVF